MAEIRGLRVIPSIPAHFFEGQRGAPRVVWERLLPARPEIGSEVRRHVRLFAAESRADEVTEYTFVQVVDELVSNAVKALRCEMGDDVVLFPYGPCFGVRLGVVGGHLFAQVWDSCPLLPELPPRDSLDSGWLFAEGGRGLPLVQALSSSVAVVRHANGEMMTKSLVVTLACSSPDHG